MGYIRVPFLQVDAFTDKPFRGNPAAVCLMPCDLSDSLYLKIAQEVNPVSAIAFHEPLGNEGEYKIRWFTTVAEDPLCGHATLATAHVIFNHLGVNKDILSFQSMSGIVKAWRSKEGIRLDFPRNDPVEIAPPKEILNAMGISRWEKNLFAETANRKLLVHLENQRQVIDLQPDFDALLKTENKMDIKGIITTARSDGTYDFISRYFNPWLAVNEDPVTGSAHTVLAPHWSKELNKKKMRAFQASKRGGVLLLELTEDRVYITGRATTVIEGELIYHK